MDKLAKRLRDDAEQIEVGISAELDNRIQASLAGVRQEHNSPPARAARPALFWWASSLTGVAATIAVIAIVNLGGPEPELARTEPQTQTLDLPKIDWKPRTAVLTQTLEQELQDIQSDLKKAEQAVKEDFDEVL